MTATAPEMTRLYAQKIGVDSYKVQASYAFDGFNGRIAIGTVTRLRNGWSFDIGYAGAEFGRGGEPSLQDALRAIRQWVDAVDAEDAAREDDGYFNEDAAYEAAQDNWAFWQGEIERNARGF